MTLVTEWKTIREDSYNKVYQRRIGDALLTVGYSNSPDDNGVAWYCWMINRDGDDCIISSKEGYFSFTEAVNAVEAKLKRLNEAVAVI